MAIKNFPIQPAVIINMFCTAAILIALLLAGCTPPSASLEKLDDFDQRFPAQKNPVSLLDGKILTLEQAVKHALNNNPTNLAAAQAVSAAKYGYYRALSAYAPEINAEYSLGHTLSRGWNLKNPPEGVMKKNDHFITAGTIHTSLLLFDGFARELEMIIAKEEYRKSQALGKNVKRLLERAVAYTYYDLYLAEEEIIIYTEDLNFQNNILYQEEQRFRNGHVSKASVLNFKILAARAKSSISNARYRRKVALHALCSLMGCDPGQLPENFSVQKMSTGKAPVLCEEKFYLELAVRHRPDLAAEKTILDIAFRNRQKSYSAFLPEIRIFSEFSQNTFNARYGGYRVSNARSRQGEFLYGLSAQWNIFRGFDSLNQLRQQEVLERIAWWGVNAKFLEIMTEVRDARSNCQNSGIQIGIFRDMAKWVREQRDLVLSEYRNGRETIPRLNEAQSVLIEAQSRLVISTVEFHKAAAQLAAATGTRVQDLQFRTDPLKNAVSDEKLEP